MCEHTLPTMAHKFDKFAIADDVQAVNSSADLLNNQTNKKTVWFDIAQNNVNYSAVGMNFSSVSGAIRYVYSSTMRKKRE